MAADLVRRSPLTVEFITDKFDTAQQPLAPASFTSPIQPIETSAAAAPATETRSGARVSHRSFVLGVFPADGYRHKTTIRQSPLHGPWPPGRWRQAHVRVQRPEGRGARRPWRRRPVRLADGPPAVGRA